MAREGAEDAGVSVAQMVCCDGCGRVQGTNGSWIRLALACGDRAGVRLDVCCAACAARAVELWLDPDPPALSSVPEPAEERPSFDPDSARRRAAETL